MPFNPMVKFGTYNLLDVGGKTFQVKTGVSQQLLDRSANKIRATGPTDLKLTFSKRKFKELSLKCILLPPSDVKLLSYATFF